MQFRIHASALGVYATGGFRLIQRRYALAMIALGVLFFSGCTTIPSPPPAVVASPVVSVKLIAFNDFHGNLQIPNLRVPVPDASQPTGIRFESAGGVEQFAALVQSLKHQNPLNAVVSAGDLVGATPLISALFKDEPTIEAMNLIGVDFHAVGNHEFDYGVAHLQRLQSGGCEKNTATGQPDCKGRPAYKGATFPFLAANIRAESDGNPLFPPYGVKEFDGVKVAFIGMTLRNTPQLVRPSGTAGLRFFDEVETVNQLLPELKAKGINAVVVVVHEGGQQSGGINDCTDFKGPAKDIASRLAPEVGVVITGHTHRYYICDVAGKRVTSAGSYGTLLTEIDIDLDRATGKLSRTSARNVVVKPDGPKAAALSVLVERYKALSEPLEKRIVAIVARELSALSTPAGESTLGNLIADAHLSGTASPDRGGAVIAFNNRGSLRAPIIPDETGGVSYGALFKTQPFQNDLVVMNLTGAEIKSVLEQQWAVEAEGRFSRIMGVSKGFSYVWDAAKPIGSRVVPGSIKLNGAPIRLDLEYRVVANSFVAAGAEGFTIFRDGRDRQVSVLDLDALVEYLAANSPYQPSALGSRIVRMN
ncbi:MAG: bifunctional metallophosphatase/5'-nucleotidase [Burkholderiales bacterium]